MADFDLIVIGGGSGGVACARRAASYGARAAVIENDRLGGTCVHRGCIPKKLLVYASHFSHDFEDAAGYGWIVGERSFDWPAMVRAKVAELDRLEGIYERLLRDAGATQITGTGRLLDAHTAAVGDREAPRRDHRHRHRRPADDARHPRHRTRRELGRDVRPAGLPRAPGDRGRRLHRLRVRLHHAGPRRAGDPALPPRPAVARLRLRPARGALRRDAQGRCRSPPQHQRGRPRPQGIGDRGRDHDRRDDRGGSGAVRHRAQAQCRRPRARERGHRDRGGRRRPGRCRVPHGRRRHLRRGRCHRPHQPDAGGDPRGPLHRRVPSTTTIHKRPTTAISRRRSSPRRSSAR